MRHRRATLQQKRDRRVAARKESGPETLGCGDWLGVRSSCRSLAGAATSIICVVTNVLCCLCVCVCVCVCDKSMHVATKKLPRQTQKFCRGKHTFLATKDVFYRGKYVFLFVATKMILVAAPANDS